MSEDRAADASRSASAPVSVPSARTSGYCAAIASVAGASSRSSRARSPASDTSGIPECVAAVAASLRRRLSLGLRTCGGAQTSTVGRVCTIRRRTDRAKPLGSSVGIAPVPAISQASSAAYCTASDDGMSARMRGSRLGGLRSSIRESGYESVRAPFDRARARRIPVKHAAGLLRIRSGGIARVRRSASWMSAGGYVRASLRSAWTLS